MENFKYPNKYVEIIHKLDKIFGTIESYFSMAVMWALIAVCVVFISCRFFFHISTPWADEAARYLLIALAWSGASYAASVGDHLEIDLISTILGKFIKNDELREKVLRIIDRFAQICVFLFCGWFLKIYIEYTKKVAKMKLLSVTMLIPMQIPLSFVSVGCVLIMIHTLFKILLPRDYWYEKDIKKLMEAQQKGDVE